MELSPDVLWRQLYVEHGGVDMSMPHEAHQGGQRDAGPHHVGAKGMAKPMGMGGQNFGLAAVMTEQGAQPGRGHGLTSTGALEGNEQVRRVGERSFHTQIVLQSPDRIRRQWEDSLLVPFTVHAKLGLTQTKVFQLDSQGLLRAQAIEEHQSNEAEIARGVEAAPKPRDLVRRERHGQVAWPFQSETGGGSPGTTIAEGAAGQTCGAESGARGDFAAVMEAVQAAEYAQAVIDSLRRRLGLVVTLVAEIIEQRGFVHLRKWPRRKRKPPAGEVERIVGVSA